MVFEAKLVKKMSKDNNEYWVFEIQITKNYSKLVFLNTADLEIINLLAELKK